MTIQEFSRAICAQKSNLSKGRSFLDEHAQKKEKMEKAILLICEYLIKIYTRHVFSPLFGILFIHNRNSKFCILKFKKKILNLEMIA